MTTSFITTAIPYVNSQPHLGFAYELVLADILARHRRRRGREVRFSTGSDENSLKNVQAAAREGIGVRELVERNAAAFRALEGLLDLAPDDFVRTSVDPRHRTAVEWLWRACASEIYRREWRGTYCVGCEAFVDECDEHAAPLEEIVEDNWFFRLSRWVAPIRDAITSGRIQIVPDTARVEILAFLDGDVRDLSVSRVASRANGWGIPVPGDPGQVIYVWFDALVSYLSGLGLGGDRELLRFWSGERTHVIGKGITRFHAVYWPAFLLAAGLPLPQRIFVHGYLTVDGNKISKSGTSLAVDEVVHRVGSDALRWYFARSCRTRGDSDVTVDSIATAHDNDLADGLGNLVQRCTALLARVAESRVVAGSREPAELRARAEALPARVDAALDEFLVDEAVGAIGELVDAANRTLEVSAPWRVAKTDPAAAAAALYAPLEAARVAAAELAPFVPGISRTILDRLGGEAQPGWGGLRAGTVLPGGPPPITRRVQREPLR